MKTMRKRITACVAFVAVLVMMAVSALPASALGINDFRIGTDGGNKVVTTMEQTDKGLQVLVKHSSQGDRRNLYLQSEKVPIKPAKIEYTIDRTTYSASVTDGYHFFAFFKDLKTSNTAGFIVMVFECPVGYAESFAWLPESAKGKTWVILQDVMGNKVHEANKNFTTESYPEGTVDYGWIIDKPYVGPHSFTYDSANNKVIFDGVTIPIQTGAAKRMGMGDDADLIIQAGGNVYGKEFQYTLHSINGVKVDGSNTSLNAKPTEAPAGTTAAPTTAPKSDGGNNTTAKPVTPQGGGTTAAVPTTGNAQDGTQTSDTNAPTGEPAGTTTTRETAPLGQKLGVTSLNTVIDFDASTIQLKKSYTVGELQQAFVPGDGYDFRICDKTGKIITDESLAVDSTMKLQLYFGTKPEQTFSLIGEQAADGSAGGFPWWGYVVIGAGVLVIAGGVVAFLMLRKRKAA